MRIMFDTTKYKISDSDFKKTEFGYVLNLLGAEIVIEKRANSSSYVVYIKSMKGKIPEWAKKESSSYYLLENAKNEAESIARTLWLKKQGGQFEAGYYACLHGCFFEGRKGK